MCDADHHGIGQRCRAPTEEPESFYFASRCGAVARELMMHLSGITQLSRRARQSQFGFAEFRSYPEIADLDWPDDVIDVVEQWLYDHGAHGSFVNDYRDLDPRSISVGARWTGFRAPSRRCWLLASISPTASRMSPHGVDNLLARASNQDARLSSESCLTRTGSVRTLCAGRALPPDCESSLNTLHIIPINRDDIWRRGRAT